jgi:hypothetical protein
MKRLLSGSRKKNLREFGDQLRRRIVGIERLEDRHLLSLPPTVLGVELGSTQWPTAFLDYLGSSGLGSKGLRIPTGSEAQFRAIPNANLNQVTLAFSSDVIVASADLVLRGGNTADHPISQFSYDSENLTATWTFADYLDGDRYHIDLSSRVNSNNVLLDGEWVNGQPGFPSGDGVP